jgi:hypothetical protein
LSGFLSERFQHIKQFFFFYFHFLFLIFILIVVIAEKMKKSVDCKPFEFFIQGNTLLYCLPPGSMEVDHDIAKEKFGSFYYRTYAFQLFRTKLRERKNICSFIYSAKSAVQHLHCPVIHKEDAELSFLESEELERLP